MTEDCPYCKVDERNEFERDACPFHSEGRANEQRFIGVLNKSPGGRLKRSGLLRVVGPNEWFENMDRLKEILREIEDG